MINDKAVKEKIKERLKAGAGDDTRVITRWKLALKAKDWGAVLRSVTNNNVIDGFYVTRTARRSKRVGFSKWQYEWDYAILYFKTVRDNGASANSEDELNDMIERVCGEFEDQPMLGFEEQASFGVDKHSELQVLNMDTLDNTVHIAQCKLTVYLTKVK